MGLQLNVRFPGGKRIDVGGFSISTNQLVRDGGEASVQPPPSSAASTVWAG